MFQSHFTLSLSVSIIKRKWHIVLNNYGVKVNKQRVTPSGQCGCTACQEIIHKFAHS